MIVLFTSNTDGGMLHFVIQLLLVLKKQNKKAVCFLPEGSIFTCPEELKNNLIFYEKFRTININDKRLKELATRIYKVKPSFVWYGDSSILSMQLSILLKKVCKQVLSLHDAGAYHPTNRMSLKERMQRIYTNRLLIKSMQSLDVVQVLSDSCAKSFDENYPAFCAKRVTMPLGATMPEAEEEMPKEMEKVQGEYFLFFGRIDKYKGIANICKAYAEVQEEKLPLILAGGGSFTEEEEALIKKDANIIPVNRYIPDGEMLWLMAHARCVVLPYIEATQSGVLPVAYAYEKPAITSHVEGLTQFMEEGKTGYICKNTQDYKNAILSMMQKEKAAEMGKYVKEYYKKYLDWETNVSKFVEKMQMVQK